MYFATANEVKLGYVENNKCIFSPSNNEQNAQK